MNPSVELSLETLQTLLKQQEGVFRQRYRITEVGIFGSYARGGANSHQRCGCVGGL